MLLSPCPERNKKKSRLSLFRWGASTPIVGRQAKASTRLGLSDSERAQLDIEVLHTRSVNDLAHCSQHATPPRWAGSEMTEQEKLLSKPRQWRGLDGQHPWGWSRTAPGVVNALHQPHGLDARDGLHIYNMGGGGGAGRAANEPK